jgi:predicted glycoside hydrolase/deacetylase ChbG (UPF0249 family)
MLNALGSAAAALGLLPDERAIILHADDVGMCHATIPAFRELAESGSLSSASVMVPCPWFGEVARYCKKNPAVDVGVHLTLTSEWAGYRWAAISTVDVRSGLVDEGGFLHSLRSQALKCASPEAVYVEMRAQLTRARAAGIDVTHLDAHMFTALGHPLTEGYLRLGIEESLPSLAWREGTVGIENVPEITAAIRRAETRGLLTLDRVKLLPSGEPHRREHQFRAIIDGLPPGLTHLLIHPSIDTPELRQIVPAWRERVADYEFFRGKGAIQYLERAGVRVVGYRALRDALRRLRTNARA